ncbi:MAG: glycosyltransferase [Bacteroidota bacterium]|nr:glycosyltransferase [Bacteroidota bacterium]MDP4249887.1 glycosyltransferase [Bacteroidota bacterium]
MQKPIFSILLPTWNNLPYLKLCIESLRRNSAFRHEIIVHINEGKDGTRDWVAAQKDLLYTFSEQNVGVCFALNQSRTLATTEYIVYLNDDMWLCPGWDRALYDEINAIGHPLFFLSATAIEPMNTGNSCVIVSDFGKDPGSFNETALLEKFAIPVKQDWSGATWPPNVVHKKIWDLVGGYSIEFSPGLYSDPDFSMKLWQAGVRIFKGVSASRAYHFGGKSTSRMVRNRGYYTFISKWGMTSGTFTRIFLRSGAPYAGALSEPESTLGLRMKNAIKRLGAAWQKPVS